MVDIKEITKNALANKGSFERIKRVMRRAERGNKIVLGYLGGSITQGSLSTTPETCYAYLVYQWWSERFPLAEFEYVNAGIGGTTSQFGVARVDNDLLSYHPDFVIVEFSVNDDNTELFEETYEGLVRKIYKHESEIGILIVNNVNYVNGINAQEIHNRVGKYYDLPCVSVKNSLYPFVENGEIKRRAITPDDLHPNDVGHKIISEIIIDVLEKIYHDIDVTQIDIPIPKAFTRNEYEASIRYQNDNYNPVLNGFEIDYAKQENIRDLFKKGWSGSKIGDNISFYIEGTGIAIQYRKTINKPTPIAQVTIDDDGNEMILDGNFSETWGDCLYIDTVRVHGKNKKHKVKIEIIENNKDDKSSFYLVCVIGSY
ncbi:MAG: SGNH/GDSL hydrolase family protein [Lachnotalea sp.]